jgi:hypothetical protein
VSWQEREGHGFSRATCVGGEGALAPGVELEKEKSHGEESMLHRKRVAMAVTYVFLAMVMCVPAAFGQTVVTDAQITNQTATNTCNGDLVTLNGTLHQEMSFSTNPSGMTHFSMNATSHLTGVGTPSGATYIANDTTHMETNFRGTSQEITQDVKMKLISQGPQPNMTDTATMHVVIKNNDVKVEFSKHVLPKCN